MKRLTFILILPILATTASTAQVYDPETGAITLESQSGSRLVIHDDREVSRGFSIALGGYEVAFTGSETFDELPPKERRKMRTRKRYRGHLSPVDFGFTGLTSPDYGAYPTDQHGFLDLRNGKSIYLAVTPFSTSTALDRSGRFGFTTGLSLVWRNYSFDNHITLEKRAGMIVPVELVTNNFKKSKLTTVSLDIPIIFEANFRKFFISAGGYAGIVMGSHTKYKSPKTKSRGGTAVGMFEYGLTARAGFRHFYLFGNYGLNELFQSGKGPATKTYTAGFGFPF